MRLAWQREVALWLEKVPPARRAKCAGHFPLYNAWTFVEPDDFRTLALKAVAKVAELPEDAWVLTLWVGTGEVIELDLWEDPDGAEWEAWGAGHASKQDWNLRRVFETLWRYSECRERRGWSILDVTAIVERGLRPGVVTVEEARGVIGDCLPTVAGGARQARAELGGS